MTHPHIREALKGIRDPFETVRDCLDNSEHELQRREALIELNAIKENMRLIGQTLQRYINAYPAFRIKPIGAPNSEKRDEQERLMRLEDLAKSLIKQSKDYTGETEW